jgi:hypothetical protein
MKPSTSILVCALLAGNVSANYYKVLRNITDTNLVTRQTQTCTSSSSCEVCFGPGNVGCFV